MAPPKFWKLDRYEVSPYWTTTIEVSCMYINHCCLLVACEPLSCSIYRKILHHADIRFQFTSCHTHGHTWHKTTQSIFVRIRQKLLLTTTVCNECSHTNLLQITVISNWGAHLCHAETCPSLPFTNVLQTLTYSIEQSPSWEANWFCS